MNSIRMTGNSSRIAFDCIVSGVALTVWVDTGAPNTVIPTGLLKRTGLKLIPGVGYSGAIAGYKFSGRPAVTIPEIAVPGAFTLRNVRAVAALDGDMFSEIIILGLNVLNHGITRIERDGDGGIFEFYESLTSKIPGSRRSKYDHLIMNGKYLLTDADSDDAVIPPPYDESVRYLAPDLNKTDRYILRFIKVTGYAKLGKDGDLNMMWADRVDPLTMRRTLENMVEFGYVEKRESDVYVVTPEGERVSDWA